jgi:hypothetical protein
MPLDHTMPDSTSTLFLRSKGTILGRVEFQREDWPWNYGRFHPTEAFSRYAMLFTEAERLRTAGDSAGHERHELMRKIIELDLELIGQQSGEVVGEPDLLWICHDQVSWRGHSGALRAITRTQS